MRSEQQENGRGKRQEHLLKRRDIVFFSLRAPRGRGGNKAAIHFSERVVWFGSAREDSVEVLRVKARNDFFKWRQQQQRNLVAALANDDRSRAKLAQAPALRGLPQNSTSSVLVHKYVQHSKYTKKSTFLVYVLFLGRFCARFVTTGWMFF